MIADEQAREAAKEILAADAYTRWDSDYGAWLDLFDRLAELTPDIVIEALSAIVSVVGWFGGWLIVVLEAIGIKGSVAPVLGWLAVAAMLVALIALAAQWRMRRAVASAAPADPVGESDLHAAAVREAGAAAQNGLFLEAAHRIQLACLAFLIEGNWVELARSDANPTLRERVAASALPGPERADLIALVDRLERRWFGVARGRAEPAAARATAQNDSDRALYDDWVVLDRRLAQLGFRSEAA